MYTLTKPFMSLVCLTSLSITSAYAVETIDTIEVVSTFLSGGDAGDAGGGGGGGGRGITITPNPLRTDKENTCAATQQIYTALKCAGKSTELPSDLDDLGTRQFSQAGLFEPTVVTLAQAFYNARSITGLRTVENQAFGAAVTACQSISLCVAQVQVYFGANTLALPQSMWGDTNALANEYMRFLGTNTPPEFSPVGKLFTKNYGAQSCQKLKQSGTDNGCTPQ